MGIEEQDIAQSEETKEQGDTSFAAGFNKVRGTEPEESTTTAPTAHASATSEEQQSATAPTTDTPPPKLIAGMSEEEVVARLNKVPELEGAFRKQIDGAYGKLGRIEQAIQSLQEKTPAGEPVEVTTEDMADLKAEFPELADLQMKAFNNVLKRLGRTGSATVDQEAVAKLVSEQVGSAVETLREENTRVVAKTVLSIQHPDWQTVRQTPEYKAWLQAQSEEFRNEFLNTWDPAVVAEGLTKFKDARDAAQKAHQRSQSRIGNAVTPTNGGSATPPTQPSSHASFAKGFSRVRGVHR